MRDREIIVVGGKKKQEEKKSPEPPGNRRSSGNASARYFRGGARNIHIEKKEPAPGGSTPTRRTKLKTSGKFKERGNRPLSSSR